MLIAVVVLPRFELISFCTAIQSHRITIGILVPPILILLAKHPEVAKYDFSSLREILCGAAPLSGELSNSVKQRLGTVVKQGYGLSETSPVAIIEETDDVVEGQYCELLLQRPARLKTNNAIFQVALVS
jgi:acyl-CoA synthetase (AMP-forming)/AMP-acid ligase II